jgi:glycine/D-amino acid oxidase-like deaminating enzyme
MLTAPGIGLALAELIVDGAPRSLDLRPFDPARLLGVRMSVPGTMLGPAGDGPLG